MAVDLDGTLLGPGGTPFEADVAALKALMRSGVHVSIITGRMFSGSVHAAEALALEGLVACVDGAHIVEMPSRTDVLHRGLAGEVLAQLKRAVEQLGLTAYLFADDQVVHDDRGAPHLDFLSVWSKVHQRTQDLMVHHAWEQPRGVTGLLALGPKERLEALVGVVPGEAISKLIFPAPGPAGVWGAFIRAPRSDKGEALRWVAARLSVPIEETVAIGDWLNDVPMLTAAGRSFAMAHAPPEVKGSATRVVPQTGSEGGGIAHAIKLVWG